MPKPEKLILVCSNQRPPGHPRGSCATGGSQDVLMKFSELLDIKGLWGTVSLAKSSCLGPCYDGPVVSIFPDNIWYGHVTASDVEGIIEEHVVNGKPIERLLIPDEAWG
jgi:(2Fe-2S) ferredoxin